MADAQHPDPEDDAPDTVTPGYKAPAEKTLTEIISQDAEDESLRKYKEALLGGAQNANAIPFPDDPRRVIVSKCSLLVDGRPDEEMDLTADLKELKKKSFVMKEGSSYKVKVYFHVQREIVTGLRFVQKSYKKGIQVDKSNYMVGSYGPKMELQSYTTPAEDVPSGMLARGSYTNKTTFTDDDKNVYLKWEWTLEIKKDWAN